MEVCGLANQAGPLELPMEGLHDVRIPKLFLLSLTTRLPALQLNGNPIAHTLLLSRLYVVSPLALTPSYSPTWPLLNFPVHHHLGFFFFGHSSSYDLLSSSHITLLSFVCIPPRPVPSIPWAVAISSYQHNLRDQQNRTSTTQLINTKSRPQIPPSSTPTHTIRTEK